MIYDYKEALAEWQGISRKLKRYPRYFVQKPETNTTWCHIQTDSKNGICTYPPPNDPYTYDILLPEFKGSIIERILDDYNAANGKIRIMGRNSTCPIHMDHGHAGENLEGKYTYFFVMKTNEHSFYVVQPEDSDRLPDENHYWQAYHWKADGRVHRIASIRKHAAMNGGSTMKIQLQFVSKDDLQ